MIIKTAKKIRTRRRHHRIRKKVSGTTEKPRLSFYKSNKHIYAQIVDDIAAGTLVYCSTLQEPFKPKEKVTWTKDAAKELGALIGKNAVDKGIKEVVFDRGGYKYHGKVTAFADGAREAGLVF